MTFILPSFGASAISAVPGGGFVNTYSLKFDATNEALRGPLDGHGHPDASTEITLGSTDPWTISFWYKNDNLNTDDTSMFNHNGSDYFRLINNSSGEGNVVIFNSGYRMQSFVTSAIDFLDWVHVAYTHDGSGLHELFVNGSSYGTVTYTDTFDTDGWIYGKLGAEPDSYIDEVAFFASDLSSNISALYNSGVAGDLDSLDPTHWYRMEEGSGTTVTNSGSAGGLDLVTVNSPTFENDVPS